MDETTWAIRSVDKGVRYLNYLPDLLWLAVFIDMDIPPTKLHVPTSPVKLLAAAYDDKGKRRSSQEVSRILYALGVEAKRTGDPLSSRHVDLSLFRVTSELSNLVRQRLAQTTGQIPPTALPSELAQYVSGNPSLPNQSLQKLCEEGIPYKRVSLFSEEVIRVAKSLGRLLPQPPSIPDKE